jgi:AhpD family alkylhydroperoxidase
MNFSKSPRLPHYTLASKAAKAMIDLSAAIKTGPLPARFIDLILLRVSQINGCAYCVDLHWRDMIADDVDPRKLNALVAWEEMPFFDERERAALHWTDMLTKQPNGAASDADFEELRRHFSDEETAQLTYAIGCMNSWNRIAIGMRNPIPESSKPGF